MSFLRRGKSWLKFLIKKGMFCLIFITVQYCTMLQYSPPTLPQFTQETLNAVIIISLSSSSSKIIILVIMIMIITDHHDDGHHHHWHSHHHHHHHHDHHRYRHHHHPLPVSKLSICGTSWKVDAWEETWKRQLGERKESLQRSHSFIFISTPDIPKH